MIMHDPMAQLERSHRRLEEACDALSVAALDRDLDVVADVCAFFANQVRRHEQDEEESLFPRLAGASADASRVITRLSAEHREHEALHARLEALLAEAGQQDLWTEIASVADRLVRSYRTHIEDEERHVFPAARQMLPESVLDEIAREMQSRRGRG